MRRRVPLIALMLVLAAGCGGSAGSATPGSASAGPSATATAATSNVRSATPGAAATSAPSLPTLTTTSIALDGDGPIGLTVDGTTAWVITADGGELLDVDLAGAAAQR